MTDARLILHIGAPKCGSSALQTALSAAPDHKTTNGISLRYTAPRSGLLDIQPLLGDRLSRRAARSVYGYVSWPNLLPEGDISALSRAVRETFRQGEAGGFVPILSSEAWIYHDRLFAGVLADLGHPPVDVIAYLRPPVEWVNAAWWQWGVWSAPSLDFALRRGGLPFTFGETLERWSAIPNVRLHVRRSRPDAVARFADHYGLTLPRGGRRNATSGVGLIGVLLRNRHLRQTGHDPATEFAFQRWCPEVPGPRPWAIRARHVHMLRPVVARNLAALRRVLPEAEMDDLLKDGGWTHERVYHKAIGAPETRLDDPDLLPPLFEAVQVGVEAAATALGISVPDLPTPPRGEPGIEPWDRAVCAGLETLLRLDKQIRDKAGNTLIDRLHDGLGRMLRR